MLKSIRVKIGGKEYTLRGEDEQKILTAADEVNTQLELLRGSLNDQSSATHAIVAALNIAEKNYEQNQNITNDLSQLVQELERMAMTMEQSMK